MAEFRFNAQTVQPPQQNTAGTGYPKVIQHHYEPNYVFVPFPAYAPAPDRWDVNDQQANRKAHETDTMYHQRALLAARYWAEQDEKVQRAQQEKEDKLELKRERNRKAQAEFRKRQREQSTYSNHPAVAAAKAELDTAVKQQEDVLAQWEAYVLSKRSAYAAAVAAARLADSGGQP